MKQFLLFVGEAYYACGGFNDFNGDFESVDDCLEKINSLQECDWQWFHIFDTVLCKVVLESKEKPHGVYRGDRKEVFDNVKEIK